MNASSSGLKTIELRGYLAEKFGKEFQMVVSSPIEAYKALACQLDGFRDAIAAGSFYIRRVTDLSGTQKVYDVGEDELTFSMGKATRLIIEPAIHGAARPGLGKLLIGIAIIAVAVTAAVFFPPAAGFSIYGASVYLALGTGLSLALAGAGALLAGTPEVPDNSEEAQNKVFSNISNTVTQGQAIPCAYGQIRVGSILVAAELGNDFYSFITLELYRLILEEGLEPGDVVPGSQFHNVPDASIPRRFIIVLPGETPEEALRRERGF